MQRLFLRSFLVVATIGAVLGSTVESEAQARKRGKITDEWGNGLEGVTVLAEPQRAGAPQTVTTDDDGNFQFMNLVPGDWAFTATLDGYQGLQQIAAASISSQRALNFEMPVLGTGGRFRERTEFEGENDIPRFRFEEDGTFEFEDAEGEGEGTYGIVERSALLIVRDYDGPDDKFDFKTPVVLEFSNAQFTHMTHEGIEIPQK
ncbi:MAG: carboxypeptidase-like regulatory domain-containing protein [Acidobacteriota bacterium]|nr:carboxypeptidase-like regulatory domain-containing protein [Acidobacteriota bacterium]